MFPTKQVYTPDDVAKLMSAMKTKDQAAIFDASTNHPFSVQGITIPLDTAQLETNPYKIGFPFKSVFVADATDLSVQVNLKIGTRDSFQTKIPLKKKDAFKLGQFTSEAYLDWTAQSGKTITIFFFTDSEFVSGSLIQQTSGGVQVSEGSAVALNSKTLSAATAAIIAPQNANRVLAILQNQTGANVWLGDSTVTNAGATQGILIPPLATFEWRNSAALYGYSVAGGNVNFLECT